MAEPSSPPAPLLIGLTGGIAAGKSTVARLFEEAGARVIGADMLARQVVAPGSPALNEIARQFGDQFIDEDGGLNRQQMGQRVFADPSARQQLEAILHPRIQAAFQAQVARFAAEDPHRPVVYDAPLLIEAGAYRLMDKVVVVDLDRASQIARIRARDGLSEAEAGQRIDAQISRKERCQYADEVLAGDAKLTHLKDQVQRILTQWVDHAPERPPSSC